jgi:F-type H+-transporting ATPase subunit b
MAITAFTRCLILASGGGEEAPSLPHGEGELATLIWVFVIFLILLGILWKFAWKPLLAAVEARERRIADSLKKAEEIQRASAEIAAKQEAALAEAQSKAKAVLDEARAQSEDFRKRELERAKADADAFLDRAKKEISLEENRVRDALRREVVEMALEVSSKVLERNVSTEDDRRLADRLLGEVKAKRAGAARN